MAHNIVKMSYARSRLWLGITSVGFWVIAASVVLFFNADQGGVVAGIGFNQPFFAQSFLLIKVLALYVLFSFPFDLVGGWWLPAQHDRHSLSLWEYLSVWLRGVVVHSLCIYISAILLIMAGGFAGVFGAVIMLLLLFLFLLLMQFKIASCMARMNSSIVNGRERWSSQDEGFTGGWVGLPGLDMEIQPASWDLILTPEELSAQSLRRIGVVGSGSRFRGILWAIIFNLVGFVLIANFLVGGLSHVGELIVTASWFTLWSFFGLLLLPRISRAGVYEVDAYALREGVDPELLISSIRKIDKLQEDEANRSRQVESVFHPIPSVENRVARIRKGDVVSFGAHHAARNALFLSWACLGVLSRAVHCNAGRPPVWVVFPSD